MKNPTRSVKDSLNRHHCPFRDLAVLLLFVNSPCSSFCWNTAQRSHPDRCRPAPRWPDVSLVGAMTRANLWTTPRLHASITIPFPPFSTSPLLLTITFGLYDTFPDQARAHQVWHHKNNGHAFPHSTPRFLIIQRTLCLGSLTLRPPWPIATTYLPRLGLSWPVPLRRVLILGDFHTIVTYKPLMGQ